MLSGGSTAVSRLVRTADIPDIFGLLGLPEEERENGGQEEEKTKGGQPLLLFKLEEIEDLDLELALNKEQV